MSSPSGSSASSTSQSRFVFDKKLKYVFSGGDDKPDEAFGAGELTSLVRILCGEDEEGGVLGREEEPERFLT